jgi:RNA polymerase sigma factor (sigma-70 family)
MELEEMVRRARGGDLEAFEAVTRRFQQMAFGSALALVRDLQQAEDIVQETFVAAWFSLPTLAEPAAFPGWLRSIVRHQAHRVLRQKRPVVVPLDQAEAVPAAEIRPDQRLEHKQRMAPVQDAITRLPAPLREVVTLFYVHECSQQDVATFLGLPVTTVNTRLHAARRQLKRRMLTMVKETLEANQLPDDFAKRIGWIVRTRERVIEARFDPASLPDVLTELSVSDESRRRAVSVQVVQRLEDGIVRGVTTAPADALAPGMTVLSAGRHGQTPVSREAFGRLVRLLASSSPEPASPPKLLETGIKVIDVTCPLVAGGTVAIAGEFRSGTIVLVEELVRRLSGGAERLSMFAFVTPPTSSMQEMWQKEGYSEGTVGAVQTFYLLREEGPWTVEGLAALTGVDVVIRLSRDQAERRVWPPVDPLTSRSRLFDDPIAPAEHAVLASRVRNTLALLETTPYGYQPAVDDRIITRAEKLRRFLGQPFFSAERYTHRPGALVPLAESLRVCGEILDGVHDDVPTEAFFFTGGIDEIRSQGTSPAVTSL